MLMDKLGFLGDAYHSRPKISSNLSMNIVIPYILVQINFCSYVVIPYNLPVIHKQDFFLN